MLTGQGTVETAIESMKLGAYDYLTKPYRIAELAALVDQASEKHQLKIDNTRLRAQIARTTVNLPDIIAESPQMKEVLRLVRRVAPADTSVLITGESGTGKELIAQAIHRLRPRTCGCCRRKKEHNPGASHATSLLCANPPNIRRTPEQTPKFS